MNVTFQNASADGLPEVVALRSGATLGDLLQTKTGNRAVPRGSAVRIRRGERSYGGQGNPVSPDTLLEDGDKVSLTPSKPDAA
jgi:hypothetical protein